jgi:hypothetical protein
MSDMDWPLTVWSAAHQVNALNGGGETPEDQLAPARFFRMLRTQACEAEAALFLAQALPRYEAVLWADGVIGEIAPTLPPAHQPAIAAVRAWLADPSEANRRAAGEQAGPTDPPAAATLCALAAFHTGGSVAPPDQPAVPPPRGATGRFAGAAVIVAAALSDDPAAALRRALDDGERIASGAARVKEEEE